MTVVGFRLSEQQQRIWHARESAGFLCAQALARVDGVVDLSRLGDCVRTVVNRHDALRARYEQAPGTSGVVMVIGDDATGSVEWTADPGISCEWRHVLEVAADERRKPVAVAGALPVRARVFSLAPDQHALLITTSALSADARTICQVIREIADAYDGRDLGPRPLQYPQFSEWQHQSRASVRPADGKPGATTRLTMPLLQPVQAGTATDPARVMRSLSANPFSRLAVYAQQAAGTPVAVLLSCFGVLLQRITNEPALAIGVGFAARPYEEMQECAGTFALRSPITIPADSATTFQEITARTDRVLRQTERDIETLIVRPPDDGPWDVAFDASTSAAPIHAGGATFTLGQHDVHAEPNILRLECLIGAGQATIVWHYRPEQLAADYVECLADQYLALLADLLDRPAAPIALAGMLDERSRAALPAMRPSAPDQDQPQCLHQAIQLQVERSPNATAVEDATTRLTYRSLSAWADALAARLQQLGAGPDRLIAVSLGHTRHLLVAILAVLKAGSGYLPIDPELPPMRVRQLLERTGCDLMLTGPEGTAAQVAARQVRVIPVDRHDPDGPGGRPTDNGVGPDNIAYTMFTSGSTGEPKGVMIPHRAVTNYVLWAANAYLTGGGGTLVHSSIGFDLTVTSLFAPLVAGRAVHIAPELRNPFTLAAKLHRGPGSELLKLTPSHLSLINQALVGQSPADATRSLVIGGENLRWDQLTPWRGTTPGVRIFNEYGPTETTVGCTVYEVGDEDPGGASVPIGRPIADADVWLLDGRLRPVPIGVAGEICVAGPGLARGYLAAPSATAERFVPHPWSSVPGQRLYRTGDIGVRSPDGQLRFLGRVDEQIKVRGVRVEPAEVEAVLREHPAVGQAAVALRSDGEDAALIAYVTAAKDMAVRPDLRAFLADRLPTAMVPADYVWLAAMPLTASGKVNKELLPLPTHGGDVAKPAARAPASSPRHAGGPTERIAAIFAELTGVSDVASDDEFFDLGGYSALAVQLIARINADFDAKLPVSVLFEESGSASPATPRALAAALARAPRDSSPLVCLRSDGDQAAIFCAHPAGGDAVAFRSLAASPKLLRPVYALQPENASGWSIEQMAERYTSALVRCQPREEYLLMGWSMGGLIALEMARRLRITLRLRVPLLILVDSYLQTELTAEDLIDVPDVPDAPDDEIWRTHTEHLRAARQYRPRPYEGRVVLIQASETSEAMRAAAVRAWQAICPGLRQTEVLQGDHYSLLKAPRVDNLARLIEVVAS
jgi:amino acid adenylation domain-containing protein